MPDYTTYLNLTLPELNEFVDSWNEPVNQNMEDLDDYLDDLHDNLVGIGTGSVWSALRGSKASLAERLDVSVNADGTIDVSSSADILNMALSAVKGDLTSPRDRLDDGDFEVYAARQPVENGRFVVMPAGGPLAGYPPEELDSGIAIRSADYGIRSGVGTDALEPVARPWAPGLILGGASPFMVGVTESQVRFNASGAPAIFNIDGYIFRIREDILFDYAAIGPGVDEYLWFYVERIEGSYGGANFKYSKVGGTPVAKDLRKLKTGTAGAVGGTPILNTFEDAAAAFDSLPFKIKEGDTLVITGAVAAAGSYVIQALDGASPDTKLTIKGQFYGAGSGLSWYVQDNSMPHIGVAVAIANPTVSTSRPPVVDGRVYFAQARHRSPLAPDPIVNFAKGGVYDSGWQSLSATTGALWDAEHGLGAIPSEVEIWVRVDATTEAYRPLVRREFMVNFDTGNTTVELSDLKLIHFWIPSMHYKCTETDIEIFQENASPDADPASVVALFTDSGGTDQPTGQIRVIARR